MTGVQTCALPIFVFSDRLETRPTAASWDKFENLSGAWWGRSGSRDALCGPGGRLFAVRHAAGLTRRFALPSRWMWPQGDVCCLAGDQRRQVGKPVPRRDTEVRRRRGTNLKICPGKTGKLGLGWRVVWSQGTGVFGMGAQRADTEVRAPGALDLEYGTVRRFSFRRRGRASVAKDVQPRTAVFVAGWWMSFVCGGPGS